MRVPRFCSRDEGDFMLQRSAERALLAICGVCTRRCAPLCFSWQRTALPVICAALALGLCACRSGDKLPEKSSQKYAEAVSAFYVGLGALQVGDDVHAESKLSEFTTLAPGEPAGW